jgi:hypothetical protein
MSDDRRRKDRSRATKVGLVLAGYVVAFLTALSVVALHGYLFPTPDSSGGMAAFGDLILFLMVFGFLALAPTGAAIFWIVRRLAASEQ